MGYFANSTEAEAYKECYCIYCTHYYGPDTDSGAIQEDECPILAAHELYNYAHADKEDSVLHKIIPEVDTGKRLGMNGECIFFKRRQEFPGREE